MRSRLRKRINIKPAHTDDAGQIEKSPLPRRGRVLAMRTAHHKIVSTPRGASNPHKTALLVNRRVFTPRTLKHLDEHLEKELESKVKSHRVGSEVVEVSATGSPMVLETPKTKTRLYKHKRYGALNFFSNEKLPNLQVAKKLEYSEDAKPDDAFYQSDVYKAIKSINVDTKGQEITITKDLLEQTHKENVRNHFRRTRSQNQVLAAASSSATAASATTYTAETKLFVGEGRWEWLHLIAHAIKGSASQHEDNLVSGREYANTDMMFVEYELKALSEKYPEGFKLEIKAELIPTTHVAKKIYYTIKTSDFEIPLEFDAQTAIKPHFVIHDYIKSFLAVMMTKPKVK